MRFLSKLEPVNVAFVSAVHLASLLALALYATVLSWSWATAAMAFGLLMCTGVGITGGYHRLFAHRSYSASAPVRLFYLLFGAAAFQNSAINWSADHRRHHGKTDTDEDPYSIKRGFWWAHIGWVLTKAEPIDTSNVADLWADPLVAFQHRHYAKLGALFGFALPTALGALWGDALGGLLLGGCVRLLIQYHGTFSVNSVAHTIGDQPWSDADSARDSLITAIITLGEGYHNYHHTFPGDYRNGVRAWQFDPTKWLIASLSAIGQTWNLKRVPWEQALKMRIRMDMRRMLQAMHDAAVNRALWEDRVTHAKEQLETLLARWEAARKARLDHEVAQIKREFAMAYKRWRVWVRRPELAFAN